MRSRQLLVACAVLWLVGRADPLRGDEHVRLPGDVPVDIYHSGGPLGSLSDGEWVVVPFWRPLASVPAGHNLLDPFDPDAVDLPLLVSGFARLRGGLPPSWEVRGNGAVPFVFARHSELVLAVADGELTIWELLGLPSTSVGTADFYQEQNHLDGIHRVSHYAMVASGEFQDGSAFFVQFVEVDLELVRTRIVFE